MNDREVVRAFFDAMQRRAWGKVRALICEDARITWTETGETFLGHDFVAMNEAYPGSWSIEVVDVVGDSGRVAAQVRVEHDGRTFWCAGFYRVRHGRIAAGTEHWVTAGSASPPEWRLPFTT